MKDRERYDRAVEMNRKTNSTDHLTVGSARRPMSECQN